jgi:multidrug efflux system membrane fusion protein
MNRRRNTIILIAGVAIVIVIALVAARRGGAHAVAVRETTIHYGAFTTKLPETGVVQHPLLITIPAGVGGNMGLINVKAGDRVVEGQLLATIVNPQLVSSLHDAEMTAMSAEGRSSSASQANAVLPAQNRSSVVQAEAAVVAARTGLNQARQDLLTGQQSGLGYSGQSAEEQRLIANATVDKAATDLREAKRTFDANNDLYNQKGISRDLLEQSRARLEQAQVSFTQAQSQRKILEGQLSRNAGVLKDRVRSAEDQLRQSLAALDSARANAAQNKAGDVEAARGDAARAEADLVFARDQVDRMSIRAPFSGVVQSVASQTGDTLRPLQPGDAITAGQPLFTMSDGNAFIVRTKVDEQDISAIRLGQRALVGGEDFAGKKLAGHVVAISPLAQKSDDPSNTSRQVLTTIALDQTVPYLRDGMTVDVDIVTHNEPHVLAVPIDAVRKDDKGNYVFVQTKDRKAKRVDVTLGVQNDTSAIVKKGLSDGDVVIADKSLAVVPDAAVTAAPSPSPGPSPAAT